MTANEKELLNLIRTHDNPEQALDIAIGLMIDFLEQRGELRDTSFEHPRVSA